MIDTLKIAIPLTKSQYKRISEALMSRDGWQWARFNPREGELKLQRIRGLAEANQHSYRRELMFDLSPEWSDHARLVMEFSLPKFWQGHNIHLLYDWLETLYEVKAILEKAFNLKRMSLPNPGTWDLLRADFCYAWQFPSQECAQAYLDSLKHLKFPYKQPVIHKTSIFFAGKTYAVKLYLKRPEFEAHDKKEMLKNNVALEWVDHLEKLADGVLRFEVTARRRYLKWRGLPTVGYLIEDKAHVIWDDQCASLTNEEKGLFFVCVINSLASKEDEQAQKLWKSFQTGRFDGIKNGTYFTLPAGYHRLHTNNNGGIEFHHSGGGFKVYQHGQALCIVQEMIQKLVGDGAMHSDNQVHQLLNQKYKPNKAARLTAFWTFCQRFGLDKAKEAFGRNPFYEARADLKAAGIDLIERPENVTYIDDDFLRNIRMKAPSEHVVNRIDNFRDATHILNFPTKSS
jgi:hypothetical protein